MNSGFQASAANDGGINLNFYVSLQIDVISLILGFRAHLWIESCHNMLKYHKSV